MNHYESLAKAIFEHEHSAPGNPSANWEDQPQSVRDPYIKSAQVATIMLYQHNTFSVEMVSREPKSVVA